jgi:tocopherol O-methyltransferase
MPFSENTFDVVWACESVCHAADKEKFYQEAFRVLKPGGTLIMAEYMRTHRPLSPSNEHLLTEWLRPWAIADISTLSEHQKLSKSSGFQRIELLDVTSNVRVSLRNLHDIAQRWLPFGKFLNKLGWVNDVRLSNAVASVRQYEALQADAWVYVMLRAEKQV